MKTGEFTITLRKGVGLPKIIIGDRMDITVNDDLSHCKVISVEDLGDLLKVILNIEESHQ
jgi:hypothetical protein